MKMIQEQIISLGIKISLLLSAFVLARFQALSELGIVDRAFEMSFSVGLMVMFLVYMIYENRKKDERQLRVHDDYVLMSKDTIKTVEDFANAMKGVAKSIERDTAKKEKDSEYRDKILERIESSVNEIKGGRNAN